MPYLRFTRDRRGYENTFLLHAVYPGERPRVLYWFRTAPDIRVGRTALDPHAIREIEHAHPEILFDWSEILEVGATAQPEVEAPRQPRKRTPPRAREEPRERRPPHPPEPRPAAPSRAAAAPPARVEDDPSVDDSQVEDVPVGDLPVQGSVADAASADEADEPDTFPDDASDAEVAVAGELDSVFVHGAHSPPTAGLLDELVGRGIATRLRGRYSELGARLDAHPADGTAKEIWRVRLEELNPDTWVTAEDVMAGMSRADALYDALRREIVGS